MAIKSTFFFQSYWNFVHVCFIVGHFEIKCSQFNISTCGFDQFPQTTRYGMSYLLQDVVRDIVENLLNSCLQVFQCPRFCLVYLLCVTRQIKITWNEIWTSWRPFMKSASSQPTFSVDRDFGRPLFLASCTEPVVISLAWQFLIVSGRSVSFLPFHARHHLWTMIVQFYTS